jgi:glycosyltransferase involved in cell wall biosynthesis
MEKKRNLADWTIGCYPIETTEEICQYCAVRSKYTRRESKNLMTPGVSVILSIFNGEQFLEDTVESILNQSFTDFEFIIIDDRSTDNTWHLLQRYEEMDERIVLIRNERNRGETYSINLGIQKSRSHLIAITQCGALSHTSRLERQYGVFRENKGHVLVGTQATYCDVEGRALRCSSFPVNDKDIRKALFVGRIIFEHPSVMFRKLGGMDYREEAVPEADFDFWLRVSFHGKLGNIHEVLVKRVIHQKRISLTRRYEQKRIHWCIHKRFYERLRYGEERSTWFRQDDTKKDLFESSRNRMLYILAQKSFKTRGFLHHFYVLLSFVFSPAPFTEIYYLLIKRVVMNFYLEGLLRKYLEIGENTDWADSSGSAKNKHSKIIEEAGR